VPGGLRGRAYLATMTAHASGPIDVSRVADLGRILSIWAHPDDETFLAGGVMAAAVSRGQHVTCVSATAGELGTDDPVTWPPDRLGQIRRWEAAAAMAVIGVTDHRFLDLPDGGLADLDPTEPVARLAAIITEIGPDSILTFGPDGGTFHPDHQTISRWVGAAHALAGGPGRVLHAAFTEQRWAQWRDDYERWGVFMTDERPVGVPAADLTVLCTVDGPLMDQKMAALCAMHTQIAPSLAVLGDQRFRELNAEEGFRAAPMG
jgi:LmbE family N-acetylglucosaminyl deacetylase